jgi:hypothetical protein
MERLIHREENKRKKKEILEETGIEVIDITPKLEKFSTQTVAPGWATTPESLEKFLEALSDKGFPDYQNPGRLSVATSLKSVFFKLST